MERTGGDGREWTEGWLSRWMDRRRGCWRISFLIPSLYLSFLLSQVRMRSELLTFVGIGEMM